MRGPHGRMLDRAEAEMQFVDCGRSLHIYTTGEASQFTRVARTPNTYRRTEAQAGFALGMDNVQRTPSKRDVCWDFNVPATQTGSVTLLSRLPGGTRAVVRADGGLGEKA